jgi:hypothetical protein
VGVFPIDARPVDCAARAGPPAPSPSRRYLKLLRQQLDAQGYKYTQLVCGDFPHTFECSKEVASDPALRDIVVALGAHQPQAYDAVGASTGLPMWSTEAHYNVPDGSDAAFLQNQLYIDKNVTGMQCVTGQWRQRTLSVCE